VASLRTAFEMVFSLLVRLLQSSAGEPTLRLLTLNALSQKLERYVGWQFFTIPGNALMRRSARRPRCSTLRTFWRFCGRSASTVLLPSKKRPRRRRSASPEGMMIQFYLAVAGD
jgi:hypothetical protein